MIDILLFNILETHRKLVLLPDPMFLMSKPLDTLFISIQ